MIQLMALVGAPGENEKPNYYPSSLTIRTDILLSSYIRAGGVQRTAAAAL